MDEWIRLTKALSDENRIRTLLVLRGRELCACRIIEMLDVAPSTVSAHMSVLSRAGLVEVRKEGRWRHYRLAGKSAPPRVRRFLRFALDMLEDDPRYREDLERVEARLAAEASACA